MTLPTWTITNKSSDGSSAGTYEGVTPEEALDDMAHDEGYEDFEDLCHVLGCSREDFEVLQDRPIPVAPIPVEGIKLGEFILLAELGVLATCLPHGICETIYLPTEVVVHVPQTVVPKTARVYKTPWYVQGSILINYHEEWLRQPAPIRREMQRNPNNDVYLIEVWDNVGDDGHVLFAQQGWRLVRWASLKPVLDDLQANRYRSVVRFLSSEDEVHENDRAMKRLAVF